MSYKHLTPSYFVFVVCKAAAMATAATLLDIAFWRALILLVISAFITGLFAVVVTRVQARENHQLHNRLDMLEQTGASIAGKVGADRRTTDPSGEPQG